MIKLVALRLNLIALGRGDFPGGGGVLTHALALRLRGYDCGMGKTSSCCPPPPPSQHAANAPGPRRRGCGCLSVIAGVLLVLLGIPMLLLPGPGIAAILGGLLLIARGLGAGRKEAN